MHSQGGQQPHTEGRVELTQLIKGTSSHAALLPQSSPAPRDALPTTVGLYMSSEWAAQVEAVGLSSLGCPSPGAQSPLQPPPSSFSTPASSALSYQDDFIFSLLSYTFIAVCGRNLMAMYSTPDYIYSHWGEK